jgi:Adenylate and Guanylate cyclase catalytic domain
MGAFARFLKDPAACRFTGGGPREAEALLGCPLPLLPPVAREGGQEVFYVSFHPHFRTLLQRHLESLLGQIGVEIPPPPGRRDAQLSENEFESVFARILRSVRTTDRGLGLANLFWMAHTRDVAEILRGMEAKAPAVRRGKYSLFPLLSSSYRRLEQDIRKDQTGEASRVQVHENPALVEGLIEDGFALTETSAETLELQHFLTHNKRYRISADLFFEMHQILLGEAEHRMRENERAFAARVARHLPGLPRDEHLRPAGLNKIAMNGHLLAYLMADPWSTGSRLQASTLLRAEAEKRRPAEFVDAFMDFVANLRRFEVISFVRDRIKLLQPGRELDKLASRGVRLYEFGEATQIVNHVVSATVLFLDLRGFTKTSEGQISERDLTRELYTVFDAFVPHIRRFGGRVDKFLGDGMMVTFGTEQADALDPLSALRAAILCQETLDRQRQSGKTYFKMGVAIHYGRAYLARFISDEETELRGQEADRRGRGGRSSASVLGQLLAPPRERRQIRRPLQRGDRDEPGRLGPARAAPAPDLRGGGGHRIRRRRPAPAYRHPLRWRCEVQGRALEPPGVRGGLPQGGMRRRPPWTASSRPGGTAT